MKAKLLSGFYFTLGGRSMALKTGQILTLDPAGSYYSAGRAGLVFVYRCRDTAQYIPAHVLEFLK